MAVKKKRLTLKKIEVCNNLVTEVTICRKPQLWLVPWCILLERVRADVDESQAHWVHQWARIGHSHRPLLTRAEIDIVARVLDHFAGTKHDTLGWTRGRSFTRNASAALRHATAVEDVDEESGMRHADLFLARLAIILDLGYRFTGNSKFDDRVSDQD